MSQPPRRSFLTRQFAAIFTPSDRPPATARQRWVAGLAVVVAAAFSLGRTGGPGPFNSVWAEDGAVFLTDAWNLPIFQTIFRPLNGYFVVVPRLLAVVGSAVGPEWGPAVLSIEAALVTGAMALAVYVASGAHVRSVLARMVIAAPVVLAPVGDNASATMANNVATLQFAATYAALWMLLWVPTRRAGQVVAVVIVVATGLSTILVALLIPWALLRVYLRRDRLSLALLLGAALPVVANVLALALELTVRPELSHPRYDPIWALRSIATWGLRGSVFGDRGAGMAVGLLGNWGAALLAGLVVLAVVVVALRRVVNPSWTLALVFGAHALAYATITHMAHGRLELRYLVGPELMLYAAMAVLLLPWPDRAGVRAHVPIIVLSVFIAAMCLLNYRNDTGRSVAIGWRGLVAQARVACEDPAVDGVWVYPNYLGLVQPVKAGVRTPDFEFGFPSRIPCARLRP